MTQAELDILARQKEQATTILQSIVSDDHAMQHDYWLATDGTDERIRQYICHVAYHPDRHGILEQCVVIRYLRMVGTYTYYADVVKAFIAHCEITKQEGTSERTAYKLTPVQTFIAAYIFGFFKDNSNGDTVRMIRTVFLMVARKFSKTGFACLLLSFYFLYYGDDNSELYIGANSTTQANVAYRELSAQLLQYDRHAKEKNSNRQSIRITDNEITYKQHPKLQRPHRLVGKLSATSGTKDGLKPEVGYIDEYSAAKDRPSQPGDALRNVIESGQANRKQPLMLITTTAGSVLDGPCVKEYNAYHDLLLREVDLWSEARTPQEQDKIFPFIAQPDLGDDPYNPKTWHKAQPHLGTTVFEDFYEEQATKARLTHSYLIEYMTKCLNLFVRDESQAWFTLEQAEALMDKESDLFAHADDLEGCVCAIDLMKADDMAAVGYVGYDLKERTFRAHVDYFMPEDSIDTHDNRFMYREWHNQGWLQLTKGKVIDSAYIVDSITARGMQLKGKLRRVRYDAAFAKDFANRMKTDGRTSPDCVIPLPQNMLNYNQALMYFDVIRDDPSLGLIIDYSPILVWNLTNCVLMVSSHGLRMPDKGRGDKNKIDGADALLMCIFDAQENI